MVYTLSVNGFQRYTLYFRVPYHTTLGYEVFLCNGPFIFFGSAAAVGHKY